MLFKTLFWNFPKFLKNGKIDLIITKSISRFARNTIDSLTYTRDLQDWGEFVRRTPDEYEAWVNGVTKECTVLELEILKDLVSRTKKKIFVDTNIPVEILHKVSDVNHVLIMLADPNISVQNFFERLDKEKQFLYQCYYDNNHVLFVMSWQGRKNTGKKNYSINNF